MADRELVIPTKKTAKRIAKAVKRWEFKPSSGRGGSRRVGPPGGGYHTLLGKLTTDLTYNSTDDVELCEGSVGSEDAPASGATTVEAHNLLYRTLWEDSFVLMQWVRVPDSGGSMYRIIWSDSASRVRGTSPAGGISAGSSGSVGTLVEIDGKISDTSITAYNVLSNFDVPASVATWCEWNQDNARWEIYAADCSA